MTRKIQPKGTLVAALDIGSHKTACFIGRVIDDEGGVDVLGVGYQASKGVKAGHIVDMNASDNSIRQTVHAAENMAASSMQGYPLRDVTIAVPGTQTKSHRRDVTVEIAGQSITDQDMHRVLLKCQSDVLTNENELIHTIFNSCRIDGQDGVRSPVGMTGDKIDVSVHVVTGDLNPLRNMARCVERSHLDIVSLCSSAYASGLSCLVEDEMDLGCTVIDMGAGVTSFAVFQGGSMIYQDAIPVGGWHVTNDIAKGLMCSHADAERIKTLYGNAIVTASDDHELIDVPKLGEVDKHADNHVSRSLLIGIIQPRIEEIFELISANLNDNLPKENVGRRVVLTGGASQLQGLRDFAQTVLDKQVRLGRPLRMSGLPDAVGGPSFSTVAGLLTYYTTHSHEMPAEIMSQADSGSLWERFKFWWKENW